MNPTKQKYIIVADDEKNTLETLGFILESAKYKVDLVKNGREALVKILAAKNSRFPVELVVTDVRMPVMSGSEFINELRKYNIKIPVLIITSYDDFDLKERMLQGESIEYLIKPFGDHEFLEKIGKLLKNNSFA